jgi:hypothetical protein
MLNLVEVTVPFGYATEDFPRMLNGDTNEAEIPTINYSSLNKALERKKEKYGEIKASAESFLEYTKMN